MNAKLQKLLTELTNNILSTLPELERKVIVLRFGLSGAEALSYSQISEKLDITVYKVKRLEASALRNLRHPSRAKHLSAIFGDPRKAKQTLSDIIDSGMSEEQALDTIEERVPALFPFVEKVYKLDKNVVLGILLLIIEILQLGYASGYLKPVNTGIENAIRGKAKASLQKAKKAPNTYKQKGKRCYKSDAKMK